ncbi:MAG: CotH kinase family protein [Acidobacteriota bacterium]
MAFLRAAAAVLCVTVIGTTDPRAFQSSSGTLFNDTVIHDVRLLMNSRDLAILRARYQENINMPADIIIDGTRLRNVAVRVRGTGSRRPDKMGLRVDFDHYTKGQQYQGLASLILDNLWQDETMIREVVAMNVFRRMGQAASHESFGRFFINNQYQGLYGLVEEIDPGFAERSTGETDGYLYEYHYNFAWHAEDLGPGLETYKIIFEPRSRELESDDQLYGPIRDLFHAVNDPDDNIWAEAVGQRLDFTQLLTFLGIEQFLGEADGFLGSFGMNNFYLYRSPVTNKHRIFPWDRDLAMRFVDTGVDRGLENILFQRAFDRPELRAIYLDSVEATALVAMDGDWLANEIDRILALVDALAREDTLRYQDVRFNPAGDQIDIAKYEEQVAFIQNLARVRPGFLLNDVARFR